MPARTHSDAAGVYAAAAGWVFHNLLEGGGGHGHRCGVLSRPGLRLSCSSAPTQRCLGGAATPAGQRRWISWAVHRGSCTALHLQRRRHVATVADRSLSGGLSAAAAAVATQAAVPGTHFFSPLVFPLSPLATWKSPLDYIKISASNWSHSPSDRTHRALIVFILSPQDPKRCIAPPNVGLGRGVR